MRTPTDVLAELIVRGNLTAEQVEEGKEKYLSYIAQAKAEILAYCNIPPNAAVPDGLFYVWVELAWKCNGVSDTGNTTSVIKAISEGDTTITYATDASDTVDKAILSYTATLQRYRRLP